MVVACKVLSIFQLKILEQLTELPFPYLLPYHELAHLYFAYFAKKRERESKKENESHSAALYRHFHVIRNNRSVSSETRTAS